MKMGEITKLCYLAIATLLIPEVMGTDGVRMEFHVREEQDSGTYIGRIDQAKAPPPYILLAEDPDINVNQQNGDITTVVKLDREVKASHTVTVISLTNNEVVEVTINVTDINDHSPYFPNGSKVIELSEISPNGSKVLLGSVIDPDLGSNGIKSSNIIDGNEDNNFKLETKQSGNNVLYLDLVIVGILDYETTPVYNLRIRVYDGGSPPRYGDIQVNITILDANDNTPRFTHTKYSAVIREDVVVGTSILQVNATDLDSGENGRITYLLDKSRDPEGQFLIEPASGIIRINKPLDYERLTKYELSVIARDNGSQTLDANAVVEINVTNVNEKPANINLIFLADGSTNQSTKMAENSSIGSIVAHISVSDPDKPKQYFANVNVTLRGDNGQFGLTTADNVVYKVIVKQSLDREVIPNYNLTVIAVDSGTPPLHATKSFTVFVTDINDNAPYFTQNSYSANIQEQAPAGNSVIKVTANDADFGDNARVSYSIKPIPGTDHEWFQIDQNTGLITTRGDSNVDCEQNAHPRITVIAVDHGLPPLSASATVDVVIHDVNDLEPVFEKSYYEGRISEDTKVGASVLTVSATDPDCNSNTKVYYYLKNYTTPQQSSDAFSIDRNTGILRVAKPLNFERRQSYEFTVYAEDQGQLDGSALVKVTLIDVNDNAPTFYPTNYSTNIEWNTPVGKEIIAVQASDLDSGSYQEIQFSIVGSGKNDGYFSINTTGTSGRIYLTKRLPQAEQVYILNVRATDGGGKHSSPDASVYISVTGDNSHPPVFRQPTYKFSISEDAGRLSIVGTVLAEVHNPGTTSALTYSITYGNQNGYFTINPQTGVISTNGLLDHDTHPFVLLSVKAETGTPPVFGSAQVNVTITDINDNAPVFSSSQLHITVKEDESLAAVLYPAKATDADSGTNGMVRYRLAENPQSMFQIDSVSGELRLQNHLDYETTTEYRIVINAFDQGQKTSLSSNMTLIVSVRNVNDNPPVFRQAVFIRDVDETVTIGKEILQVNATDRDNDVISYTFADKTYEDTFGLFGATGWIYLRKELDREVQDEYSFSVIAKDNGGATSKSATAQVTIRVRDVNDNDPVFSQDEYVFEIEEKMNQGTAIGIVSATDLDDGLNSQLQYSFSNPNIPFTISPYSGKISTSKELDREEKPVYNNVVVIVTDQGTPARSDSAIVKVIVKDINDNAPRFLNSQPLEVTVGENRPKGTSVVQIRAEDKDEKENGTVSYHLVEDDQEVLGLFEINSRSGLITTLEVLDYEEKKYYTLRVKANDDGSPRRSSTIQVTVRVKDDNDETPYFPNKEVTFRVVENTKPGTIIGSVKATDRDSGENGRVTYYVVAGNHFQLFAVNMSTGDIYCIREIDYEQASKHTIGIRAVDNSVYNPKSSTISVIIQIDDVNDNPPSFEQDPVILTRKENLPIGQVIYTFTATDRDSGPNGTVYYTIVNQTSKDLLQLNRETGELKINGQIDYELTKQLSITVRGEDSAPNVADRLHSTVTTWLFIQDENDNAPVFQGNTTFKVLENEPIDFPVAHILAVDADSNINNSRNNEILYEIISGNENGDFILNPSSGELTIAQALDRETSSSYSLQIQASDHGNPKQSTLNLITIEVGDVNDNAPKFVNSTYVGSIVEGIYTNKLILSISATDADTGINSELTYSLPDGTADNLFSLNPKSGEIRAKKELDREKQSSYILTAYVKDSGYPVKFDMATIIINVTDVNDNAPTFTEENIFLEVPENTLQPFIHKVLTTDKDAGDNSKLTFSIIGGNINNAFTIDPTTGQLSCKALDRETVSQYELTILVKDHGQPSMSSTCKIVVKVLDRNDNFPQFSKQEYSATIKEDIVMGGFVLQVSATDADEGDNAKITYSLGNDTDGLFQVDSASGNITTNGHFDREKIAKYRFHIVAKDGGLNNIRNTTVPVTINIADVNDNAPVFKEIPYRKTVATNTPANQFVMRVKADDKDVGESGEVRYELSSSGTDLIAMQYFKVDNISGDIFTTRTLGSQIKGSHMLQIKAKDMGSPVQSSTGIVEITVGSETGSVSLQFQQQNYTSTIEEHAGIGTFVTQVAAQYIGSGTGPITYNFINAIDHTVFNINQQNGQIFVKNPKYVDYETSPVMTMIVTASSSNLFAYTTVIVNLRDINDNFPKFAQEVYYSSTWEAQEQLNVYVTQVLATDSDTGLNADLTYNIIRGNEQNAFDISPPHTGIVVTKLPLDFEITPKYELVIEAVDRGNPPQSGTCVLMISVVDINDQKPNFPSPPPVIRVSEAADVGTQVAKVTANDVDTNPTLLYDFSPQGNPGQTFSIDRFSGRITLARPLDHEQKNHFVLGLVVNDTKYADYTQIDAFVEDENDNSPVFPHQSYQKTIPELTPSGTHILTVNATDADSGVNAQLTYKLGLSLTDGFFINPTTGALYTNKTVEHRPDQQILTLIVTAEDGGTPRLSAVVAVHLQITPVNQYPPVFTSQNYTLYVSEDKHKGMDITRVSATDGDRNQQISYSITNGNTNQMFEINRKSGQVFLSGNLDREIVSKYSLMVSATDNGAQPKSSTTIVTIIVQDVNDQVPVFDQSEYSRNLSEDTPSSVSFLKVVAHDNDEGMNSEIHYSITSGNDQGLFIVNGDTGDVIVTPNMSLDYEHTKIHKLIVRATDCKQCPSGHKKNSAFATITINVSDVNEHKPVFPIPFYYTTLYENLPNNTPVFQAHANDKDSGQFGVVSYHIHESKIFRIDSATGWVYSTMKLDYESLPYLIKGEYSYQFQVSASDIDGYIDSVPVKIQIGDVDDFHPTFSNDKYSFIVPGNAKQGQVIGQVNATDQDEGLAGRVFYILKQTSADYFAVNLTTGAVYVSKPFSSGSGRKRRSLPHTRTKRALQSTSVNLVIEATTGAVNSNTATTIVNIEIDESCAGCKLAKQTAEEEKVPITVILVVVFVIVAVILVIIIVIIVLRFRARKTPPPVAEIYESDFHQQFNFPLPSNGGPPSYEKTMNNNSIAVTTPDVSDRSHHSASSGRGSVEAEDDEEIMMINSNSTYLNNSSGFRSKNMPDSGIQDDDNNSEPSIQNSKDYLARLGIDSSNIQIKSQNIMQSVESMHQFSDEGGGEGIEETVMDYGNPIDSNQEIMITERNKDLGFHEPEPQQIGTLSSVINSEEEYSGSYNWDYLLDWGPQYQPLAHVFTEIARLKDDNVQPKKQPIKTVPQRKMTSNFNLQPQVKMDPPPIITNAPPRSIQTTNSRTSHGANSVRTSNSTMNISLPSLPRSPISHESSFTSPALTPSFTPSLSPLATRSPSISPMMQGSSGQTTPNRQRHGSNNRMYPMTMSSESEQELRI